MGLAQLAQQHQAVHHCALTAALSLSLLHVCSFLLEFIAPCTRNEYLRV